MQALSRVLQEAKQRELIQVSDEAFSIADKMKEIRTLLGEKQRISFSELFSAATARDEIIALFLALLELVRLGEVKMYQSKMFADILIYRQKAEGVTEGERG